MVEQKKSKVPLIIVGVTVLSITIIVIYIIFSSEKYASFPLKNFLITLGVTVVSLAVMGVAIWFLFKRFHKKDVKDLEFVKEIVSTSKAIAIWREAFMKANNIPCIHQTWNDDKVVTVNDNAIEIRNEKSFIDPSMQTSENFIVFEAHVTDGDRVGSLVAGLKVDLGEQWIRDNWNWRIRDNMTLNRFSLQPQKYPLTSSKNELTRLTMRKMELSEEGYTESELKEVIDPLIAQAERQVVSVVKPAPPTPIKSQDLRSIYPEIAEESEEEISVDDIKEDIETYRGREK